MKIYNDDSNHDDDVWMLLSGIIFKKIIKKFVMTETTSLSLTDGDTDGDGKLDVDKTWTYQCAYTIGLHADGKEELHCQYCNCIPKLSKITHSSNLDTALFHLLNYALHCYR